MKRVERLMREAGHPTSGQDLDDPTLGLLAAMPGNSDVVDTETSRLVRKFHTARNNSVLNVPIAMRRWASWTARAKTGYQHCKNWYNARLLAGQHKWLG
jgi:hypothetical protein